MLLQSESSPNLNTVTAYGAGSLEVNAVVYRHAIWFAPQGAVQALPVTGLDGLNAALLRQMAALVDLSADPLAFLDANENGSEDGTAAPPENAAQIVLIGTGATQRFLPAALLHTLTRAGVGVETMSTPAAARTYNILMMEGRRVVAALFPLAPPQKALDTLKDV